MKDRLYVLTQLVILTLYVIDPIPWMVDLPNWLRYLALGDVVAGALVVLAGLIALGTHLTPMPRPKPTTELVTGGIYRWIRHPLYTGIILVCVGWAIYTASISRLVFTMGLWVLFNYKCRLEEQYLLERFEAYKDYMSRTGRFLPGW
jgi:protein-S-isoprenylcysteine O-methyltransferase Ste14